MNGAGFMIHLYQPWKQAVKKSKLMQSNIDHMIAGSGRPWLDACGYGDKMNDGTPLFTPEYDLKVRWGEWGPEHMNAPGNACGLDIDSQKFDFYPEEEYISLLPHNIDVPGQAMLLLTVFFKIADYMVTLE